jgi:hypothetical protein
MSPKTIHQKLKETGLEISGHYSDLYVEVNETTQKIVNEYEYNCNVKKFNSNINGKLMFDIPFANDDFKNRGSL